MQDNYEAQISAIVSAIRTRTDMVPQIGLVLGSGLGDFADSMEISIRIPYQDLPGMPVTTVEGHKGAFVFGLCCGKPVVALQGRLHYYEGYSQQEITLPIRVMAKLGIKTLILTNAAGGINPEFSPGTLMLIKDHINFSGKNPLIGQNLKEFGPRFPDASSIYTPDLRNKLKIAAEEQGIDLQEGVYIMYAGPNYETPAEIHFFRTIGADATGMSTVPEALVACHCGIQVLAFSCITNLAAGVSPYTLDHSEVIATADRVKETFSSVLTLAIKHC